MTSIDICIPTFRRRSLERTMRSVAAQVVPPDTRLRILVADNDETRSAEPAVIALSARLALPVVYLHAPARNISLARNALLDAARADWIAMIDDDETAAEDWLAQLLAAAVTQKADVVFGPVLADYDADAPAWIVAHDFHSTIPLARAGRVTTGHCGNALLRRAAPALSGLRFDPALGRSGGEDTAFFNAASRAGARLAIAQGAIAFEPVAPSRLTFDWLARRNLRRGRTHGRYVVAPDPHSRRLYAAAALKSAYCLARAGLGALSRETRNFWTLRGLFHWGVVASLSGKGDAALYGGREGAVDGERQDGEPEKVSKPRRAE